MALTSLGLMNALGAVLVVATGYTSSLIFLRRYNLSKSPLVLLTAIMIFATCSPWLGVTASLFFLLLTGENLPLLVVSRIYSWSPALAAIGWVYTAVSLVKPHLAKWVAGIYIVLAAIFWSMMYGSTEVYAVGEIAEGIIDTGYTGLAMGFILLYVITFSIIGVMFMWIGFRGEESKTRAKGKLVALGIWLYSAMATLDALIQGIAVLFVRLGLTLSFLLIYWGFAFPQWVEKRLT